MLEGLKCGQQLPEIRELQRLLVGRTELRRHAPVGLDERIGGQRLGEIASPAGLEHAVQLARAAAMSRWWMIAKPTARSKRIGGVLEFLGRHHPHRAALEELGRCEHLRVFSAAWGEMSKAQTLAPRLGGRG